MCLGSECSVTCGILRMSLQKLKCLVRFEFEFGFLSHSLNFWKSLEDLRTGTKLVD